MKPIDLNQAERLLIVKTSSMGDIVHASPVAAALKRAYPHLKIGWVVEDRFTGVLEGSPCIDRLHQIPYQLIYFRTFSRAAWQAFRSLVREIRAERYQVALDLQGLIKSAIWGALGKVPVRLGGHRMREGTWLFMKRLPIPDLPNQHVVLQYLEATRWLGVEQPLPVEFPLFIPEEARQSVRTKLLPLGITAAFVSMNPSAGREWKRWHIANFAELSDRVEAAFGLPVVFVGGPGDKPLEEQLHRLKQHPLRSLIGRTSIKEVMAVVAQSAVHICGDTGTAHLAAAFGVPCVALYGPTNPDRTGPFGQRAHVLYKRPMCRRCPPDRCLRRECLQWITVDEVLQSIADVLQDASTYACSFNS
ncbi:Lipopolysaccharide heptosyltransferase 1 [bacterium HR15]|nr:Lipopolysaccharide heptosyltransferase 1 [bacterium HR15]